jgi:hypothetical protein
MNISRKLGNELKRRIKSLRIIQEDDELLLKDKLPTKCVSRVYRQGIGIWSGVTHREQI